MVQPLNFWFFAWFCFVFLFIKLIFASIGLAPRAFSQPTVKLCSNTTDISAMSVCSTPAWNPTAQAYSSCALVYVLFPPNLPFLHSSASSSPIILEGSTFPEFSPDFCSPLWLCHPVFYFVLSKQVFWKGAWIQRRNWSVAGEYL